MSAIILPSQEQLQAIYDFKNILECAFAELFIAGGISEKQIFTSKNPVKDFQNAIPRVEIQCRVGQALKQWVPLAAFKMNFAWDATATIRVVTKASATGKDAHAAFRSLVQYVCEASGYLSNGITLLNHQISWPVIQSGSSDVIKTGDGYEYSDQMFSFRFNIIPSALQALATAQQPQNQQ